MKRFSCPVCATEIHFDNSHCLTCGTRLGYDSARELFEAVSKDPQAAQAQVCENRAMAGCNWLVDPAHTPYCTACAHNRTVPDFDLPENNPSWRKIEQAKRHLFYSILKWRLPHPTRVEDPKTGLAFDFLADTVGKDGKAKQVMTGHADGLITLNLAEGDDSVRAARKQALGEPYRTLIGHMRHEVGHFYWELLVRRGGRIDGFREIFGDERADYGDALKAHYANGPVPDWQNSFISSYAASHPWEDFAETWAHYIHIVDASETAHAFGMSLRTLPGENIKVEINPYVGGSMDDLLEDWVPLTVALNCLNRSIGQPEMYPFVLSKPVNKKLAFIHDLIGKAQSMADARQVD
ncbi:putative zinc-binding metallopeptidase [Pseudoruegeria sp. SK021]|uniref:zinc-binding metallopeptidase family protein n=1 Tax=Pseudoruegeria sp. SK021 TaxID=1933035 RepID=UPI000A264D3D|nr:putative zinc-binding metallopeptidase [Pseudoruegeria sp. SK021]OSP56680.1 hypothetical protein BV911_01625 [Pseudoruegeria sp. SK021]